MNSWQYWTESIAKRLSEQLGASVGAGELVAPPNRKLGDIAFGCFRLAKERKSSPAAIAKEIAEGFDLKHTDIASVSAEGPYVNFVLNIGDAVHRVVSDIEEANGAYGAQNLGEKKELLLEYAQPNTHKEIHVGHLRNLVIGVALNRILERAQWNVVPMSYHGDVGAHVAKCLWWLVKSRDGRMELDDIPSGRRTGKFLGETYAAATRELEANPEWKDEVSEVQRKLEAHDPAWEKLWQETRRWSLDEFGDIFNDLGVKIERQYLESEVVDRGQEMVDELLKKGVAKESQGAIVVDLEDKKLGIFLIRKSDGTSLYATKDLALAELKLKEYPHAGRSLILVDNRQSLYFKQLFATLEMMEIKPVPEFVGYEFVTLKTGAMSSREGNVVAYQELRDQVVEYARGEILKRHAEDGWSEGKVEHAAWCIAMGGMKFGMLKQDSDKVFTFDLEQALAFEGATGPYCQYAATRLNSILRKAGDVSHKPEMGNPFDHASEKSLALKLAEFPQKVELAARELRPSMIALWCLETAQAVNEFYRDVPVLTSEGDTLAARLRLVAAAKEALSAGLELLGIPVPEEM